MLLLTYIKTVWYSIPCNHTNSGQDVAVLGKLGHVLRLNLAGNSIESIDAWKPDALTHLLYLDLSGNRYYTILYHTIQYYTILYYTTLYYTILCYTIL